ncbi:DUF4905 domain-containing protein [Mucilaginibacter sp. BT774]|uniref:DUF4905 domain-containing protein n=1 Tax=Mucilaginibacter sp. BT774 TaxID=3062276 RepID=UPI002675050B|nr:DUF4905 domain-containing protein [Mucilaginibacter sp. BT774]MDO3628819.1 DUF4905 domain-containing protein [Mucilaginibacter sp. BT774]
MPIFVHTLKMLQPHINYQFHSTVWRLEIDSVTDILFAEIRDGDGKRVSFSAISLENGEIYFNDLQTEERWLISIETAYDGVLLLHNYQSESVPVHKGIIAIDGKTGKTTWSNYTHAFDHLSTSGPVIYDTRLQPPQLFIADIKTGTVERQYQPSIDTEVDNHILLPEMTSIEVASSLSLQLNTFGNTMHYLDHNSFRIVSLHAFADGTLQQLLYILTADNKIVYQDLLNDNIQKLQPESFLLRKGQLIYLTGKSRLKVLNLDTF